MDNIEQNPESAETPVAPEEELSHSDKMTGIFTEPSSTFEKIAKFPVKTVDWLLPVLILLVVAAITQILVMSNEEIYYQARQKQIQQIEKTFDRLVENGQMTREQADQQLERARERMEMGRGPLGWILQTVGIFFVGFIFFFLVALIYFLFAKFAFKGDGGYTSVLVASGLTSYIVIIQIVLAAILSMAFGRLLNGVSIAALGDIDKSTFVGFILGKIDPFSIWAYSIVSLGLAKMFRSGSTTKYFILVFGVWILGSLLLWIIGKVVPFLGFLSSM
jgi:hypothetical protein